MRGAAQVVQGNPKDDIYYITLLNRCHIAPKILAAPSKLMISSPGQNILPPSCPRVNNILETGLLPNSDDVRIVPDVGYLVVKYTKVYYIHQTK